MSGGVALEEAEIPLEANGQASWFIEEAFPTTDTSDFLGSVRCTVLGSRRFTAIAVEMDAAERIFNTLSVVPVDRTGGGNKQTTLDFAHFGCRWTGREAETSRRLWTLRISPTGPGVHRSERESVHRAEPSRPHPLSYGHPSELEWTRKARPVKKGQ